MQGGVTRNRGSRAMEQQLPHDSLGPGIALPSAAPLPLYKLDGGSGGSMFFLPFLLLVAIFATIAVSMDKVT